MDKSLRHNVEYVLILLNNDDIFQGKQFLYSLFHEILMSKDIDTISIFQKASDLLFKKLYHLGLAEESISILIDTVCTIENNIFLKENPSSNLNSIYSNHCGILQNLCIAFEEIGNISDAEKYGQDAVGFAKNYFGENSIQYANALMRLSIIPYHHKNYICSKNMLLEAISIFNKYEDQYGKEIGTCMNNLGRVYEESGQIDLGILWHKKAVDVRINLPDKEDLAFSLGNLGIAIAQTGDIEKAISYLKKSLACYESINMINCRDAESFQLNINRCYKSLGEKSNV